MAFSSFLSIIHLNPKPASYSFNSLARCYRFLWSVWLVQTDSHPFDSLEGIIVTREHKSPSTSNTSLREDPLLLPLLTNLHISWKREMRDKAWWIGDVGKPMGFSCSHLEKTTQHSVCFFFIQPTKIKKGPYVLCMCVYLHLFWVWIKGALGWGLTARQRHRPNFMNFCFSKIY